MHARTYVCQQAVWPALTCRCTHACMHRRCDAWAHTCTHVGHAQASIMHPVHHRLVTCMPFIHGAALPSCALAQETKARCALCPFWVKRDGPMPRLAPFRMPSIDPPHPTSSCHPPAHPSPTPHTHFGGVAPPYGPTSHRLASWAYTHRAGKETQPRCRRRRPSRAVPTAQAPGALLC